MRSPRGNRPRGRERPARLRSCRENRHSSPGACPNTWRAVMKLSDMKSAEQVLTEHLKDPAFREEWERTALARAVANQVVAYRAQNGLSQTELARKLGVSQPLVARL